MGERPVKTNPGVNEILDGDLFQIRAARLDAALKAAQKAEAAMFSREREQRRAGGKDCQHPACGLQCEEERRAVRAMAMTLALVRWWPLETARRLAEVLTRGI